MNDKTMRRGRMIITSALPYANGSIHLGHMVEYIQADIFARFQKMIGRDCLFFCADDTHGAPIMIRAKKEGVTPEKIIERYSVEHQRDFADFMVEFDNYHSTNSDENRIFSEEFFTKLKDGGHITTRDVEQAYCEHDAMFLPDRFVRGVCPKCGAEDQYGDVCEACGSHYASTELKNPKCAVCGAPPVRKISNHYFFRVADFAETLEKYIESDALQPEVKNFLREWLKEGLREWDISRDGPYFGFRIPGETDKYFYVWLDAPIGYISSAKNWADKTGADFDSLWKTGESEIHHFIGKDIVYFHTIFWIPTLKGVGYTLPSGIHVHGFLTVNGEKMSKTKGTFINARTYLNHLAPEYLRYYYASKLKNSINDLDLDFNDFTNRVNAELVNKIANLGSRCISILNKNKKLDNRLGEIGESGRAMIEDMQTSADDIALDYQSLDFASATRKIARLADMANLYIDQEKPWELKDNPEQLMGVLTTAINAFRLITIYLKPVIPGFAEKVERILRIAPLTWQSHKHTLVNHEVGKFERLVDRVDIKLTEKIMETARMEMEADTSTAPDNGAKLIEYDDFSRVDLRTATVVCAEPIPKAKKLLKLTVDSGGEQRTIVAGIAQNYSPEQLVGKTIVIVANLKPRKLMGVESQGMLLAVNDGQTLRLLTPDGQTPPGVRVS